MNFQFPPPPQSPLLPRSLFCPAPQGQGAENAICAKNSCHLVTIFLPTKRLYTPDIIHFAVVFAQCCFRDIHDLQLMFLLIMATNRLQQQRLQQMRDYLQQMAKCSVEDPVKGFEVNFEILSRLVKTYFEAWEFCSRCHDEVVPHSLVKPQVNELVQAAEKCPRKGRSSGVAVQNLRSTCKIFVAAEGQLMKTLDLLLVNDLGFPKRYIRCLQRAEIINSMKDLMTFSLDNKVGPIESLAKYSQGPIISKKQAGTSTTSEAVVRGSKQAGFGVTGCHQNLPSCTLNSEKLKASAFTSYTNRNADHTPLLDPKSSRSN